MIDHINNQIDSINKQIAECEAQIHALISAPPDPSKPGVFFADYQAAMDRTDQLVKQRARELGKQKPLSELREVIVARKAIQGYANVKQELTSKVRRLSGLITELEATIQREKNRLENAEMTANKNALTAGVPREYIDELRTSIHGG